MTEQGARRRRRGEALSSAIFQATLEELADVGYARLTMEGVAERAGASKASLYRRWASRMELVIDAVHQLVPDPASAPDTGGLRGDLLAWLRLTARLLNGPAGEALRGVLGDALSDPARTLELRRRSRGTDHQAMLEITRRAVARGEISARGVSSPRLDVGQAMLRHQFLVTGPPISDAVLVEIVDEVLVPLFSFPVRRR